MNHHRTVLSPPFPRRSLAVLRGRAFLLSLALLLTPALALRAGALAPPPGIPITDLGTLGGTESGASAINNMGQVVGCSRIEFPSPEEYYHAFLWHNGRLTDLGTLGLNSCASAINDMGQVVGTSDTGLPTPRAHAFVWQNGHMTDLGTFGGYRSSASAINEQGQIVGDSTTALGYEHAFVWQNGRLTDLGTLGGTSSKAVDINEQGQVVGWSDTGPPTFQAHAFVWQNGRMTDLGTLGGDRSSAGAINERGQVVGRSQTATGDQHAFLWQQGRMTDLALLGDTFGQAVAINEQGQIVVTGSTAPGSFVWQDGVLTALGTLGGTRSDAVALNEQGQVVGTSYTNRNYQHAALWAFPPVGNRLLNPGFEHDLDRDGKPDGWSLAALATTSRAVKRSGSSSLRLQASGNRDFSVWQAVYGLRAGTTFDVSGWINIPATSDAFTFQLAVAWKDPTGQVLRVDTVNTWKARTSGWSQAAKTLVAPADTDHAVVRLNTTSLAATIYVDDVVFQAR